MKLIFDNNTWSLVELPHGHYAIGLKWVYMVKCDENGGIIMSKAYLIAKGYIQHPNIDIEEVLSPIACLGSVWLLLAIMALYGWSIHDMDVKSTFLNGEL